MTTRAWQKAWREKNREYTRLYNIAYRDKKNAARRANRKPDREYERQQRLLYPWKHRAKKARRRAAKKQATPSWVDHTALRKIYEQAVRAGKHVDHIIPLQHPDVCGLHVPWNLQLLTPTENMRKRNKFVP